MNLRVTSCLLWILISLSAVGLAQDFSGPEYEPADAELYSEARHAALMELAENPLDLNTADYEALKAIPFLSDNQIRSLLAHREHAGNFLSIYELQSVENFDLSTIQRLRPFTRVGLPAHSSPESLQGRHSLILNTEYSEPKNMESRKGHTGSPLKLNGRYRYTRTDRLSIGIQFDKDAGEPFAFSPSGHAYGFDFYSFHLTIFNRGIVQKLNAGDYTIQYGQGLVFGTGFALGKSLEAIAGIRKSSTGLKPYTSVAEYGYFRGLACEARLSPRISLTLMSSYRHQDGTPDDDDGIRSIVATGYHRTPNEQMKKHNFYTIDEGLSLRYRNRRNTISIGLNTLYTLHSRTLKPEENTYNTYHFRGKQNWISSLDFASNIKGVNLFGEGARSISGAYAGIAGAIIPLSSRVDWALLARSYDRNFHSFYSNALAENTSPINEKGLYSGIRLSPQKNLTFAAYADVFRFPWLKYQVSRPSSGEDLALRIEKRYNKRTLIFLQFRNKSKDLDSDAYPVPAPERSVRKQYTIHVQSGNDRLTFSSRVQYTRLERQARISGGLGLLNDLSLILGPHALSCRIALFDTDDFDTGVYSYEKDLLYNFSIANYYGQGFRLALNGKVHVSRGVDIRFKLGRFTYFETALSENKLTANQHIKRREVKIQLIIRR